MPLARGRKRRAQEPQPQSESASDDSSTEDRSSRRRRTRGDSDEASDAASDVPSNTQGGGAGVGMSIGPLDTMVKKMVRMALACEYSRQVIRRNDISTNVLGEQGSRQFKPVFAQAQLVLRVTFGMEMVEQPLREKLSISQRRAAQKSEKTATASKSWTVVSTLPAAYRAPEIIPPTQAPSSTAEASYTALYTFIISVIMLSGGSLQEQKLERYLKRANIENYTPIDRTDRILARLCREGYLVKNRDVDGGEEVIEYFVGPRGKVEVGQKGVSGLVRQVYGFGDADDENNANNAEAEDLDTRLARSLGVGETERKRNRGGHDGEDGGGTRRRQDQDGEDDSDGAGDDDG